MSSQLAVVIAWFATVSCAAAAAPIWLSPTIAGIDVAEQFPERGVWSNISIGAGSRASGPLFVMDSKQTLWIAFGQKYSYLTTVWNYDPKTDLYRWVAGPGNSTHPRNPGQLRVPSVDNAPGEVWYTSATIDHNDNIWFLSSRYCCELWMFNTTSFEFTRMYGPDGEVALKSFQSACFVTDSQNNLWLFGSIYFQQLGSADVTSNKVFHFNTTSMLLSLVSGNDSTLVTQYGDNPFYNGRQQPSCDIDANDRVWMFGGSISRPDYKTYSDVWSFDTRSTQWQLERGSNATVHNGAVIASEDFHPDNLPPARESASMVDRQDGTLMIACGKNQYAGMTNDVWLFNKTSKYWKPIYVQNLPASFSNYRTPGSVMPARWFQGTARGLNINGDLFIYAGSLANVYWTNDIWLLPNDQCANNAIYECGLNAHCVEEMIGYSCACDEGFNGDGYTCTAIPLPPAAEPVSPPLPSNEPISEPQPPISEPQSPISVPQGNDVVSSGCHFVMSLLVLICVLIY